LQADKQSILTPQWKNFLFAGSNEHGRNLAILQTIVSTCQLNGVNPYEYILDLIIRLGELMPWNWKLPPDPSTSRTKARDLA